MGEKKLRGRFASYLDQNDKKLIKCSVEEVAETLAGSWGEIPRTLNNTKAMELHLLAIEYLRLRDGCKTRYERKSKNGK